MNMKFEIIKVLIIMVIVFVAFFIVSYLLDKKQEKENEKNGVEKHIVHTRCPICKHKFHKVRNCQFREIRNDLYMFCAKHTEEQIDKIEEKLMKNEEKKWKS